MLPPILRDSPLQVLRLLRATAGQLTLTLTLALTLTLIQVLRLLRATAGQLRGASAAALRPLSLEGCSEQQALHPPYISPVPPLYLPCTSPMPPPCLPSISHMSPLLSPHISPLPSRQGRWRMRCTL